MTAKGRKLPMGLHVPSDQWPRSKVVLGPDAQASHGGISQHLHISKRQWIKHYQLPPDLVAQILARHRAQIRGDVREVMAEVERRRQVRKTSS